MAHRPGLALGPCCLRLCGGVGSAVRSQPQTPRQGSRSIAAPHRALGGADWVSLGLARGRKAMRPGARFQSRAMETAPTASPCAPGPRTCARPWPSNTRNGSHRTCTWPSNSRTGATALVHGRPTPEREPPHSHVHMAVRPAGRSGVGKGRIQRSTADTFCSAERSPAGETLNKDPPRTRSIPPAPARTHSIPFSPLCVFTRGHPGIQYGQRSPNAHPVNTACAWSLELT